MGREAGRILALCLDGTSDRYGPNKTNVVKLYEMLARTRADQLTYYQPGIGTMPPPGVRGKLGRWFATRFDLAIAWLLESHVSDAYRFLMRFHRPGDAIFVLGFSRGAYTARALAAMIHKVGLLTPGNEELIPFAWQVFRVPDNHDEASGFKATFAREVRVRFLGLWDTVSSVGWMWHPRSLPFTKYNPSVDVVRHALALDERRAYFSPNHWNAEPPSGQDVLEAWFPGVHCDVGGGYPETESGLSKIALEWMVRHAEAEGLEIDPDARSRILPAQDRTDQRAPRADAPIHESLRGVWWIAEFLPKRIQDPASAFATRWILHAGRRRFVGDGAKVHASVFARAAEVAGYRPTNLPATWTMTP